MDNCHNSCAPVCETGQPIQVALEITTLDRRVIEWTGGAVAQKVMAFARRSFVYQQMKPENESAAIENIFTTSVKLRPNARRAVLAFALSQGIWTRETERRVMQRATQRILELALLNVVEIDQEAENVLAYCHSEDVPVSDYIQSKIGVSAETLVAQIRGDGDEGQNNATGEDLP